MRRFGRVRALVFTDSGFTLAGVGSETKREVILGQTLPQVKGDIPLKAPEAAARKLAVREGLVAAATFPKWRAAARKLAVREGFEPSVGFKAYGALAKLCFRPLSHLTLRVRKLPPPRRGVNPETLHSRPQIRQGQPRGYGPKAQRGTQDPSPGDHPDKPDRAAFRQFDGRHVFRAHRDLVSARRSSQAEVTKAIMGPGASRATDLEARSKPSSSNLRMRSSCPWRFASASTLRGLREKSG